MLISLDNLRREFESDGDFTRVQHFIESLIGSGTSGENDLSAGQLYWNLEPGD